MHVLILFLSPGSKLHQNNSCGSTWNYLLVHTSITCLPTQVIYKHMCSFEHQSYLVEKLLPWAFWAFCLAPVRILGPFTPHIDHSLSQKPRQSLDILGNYQVFGSKQY